MIYKTLHSRKFSGLDKMVNEHLRDGWMLYGEQTSHTSNNHFNVVQVVVKEAEEETAKETDEGEYRHIESLAFDICRCTDESCRHKLQCMRYLTRQDSSDHTPFSATFMNKHGMCLDQIPTNDSTWISWPGGTSPVDPEQKVSVLFEGNDKAFFGHAGEFEWVRSAVPRIVAFQIGETSEV